VKHRRRRDFYSKQDFWALTEDRSGQLTHGQGSLVVAGPKPRMRPYYRHCCIEPDGVD
jgi:hypothetical protein